MLALRNRPYPFLEMNLPRIAEAAVDKSHPDKRELDRFLRGELTRAEIRRVVRHLLTGCPSCVAVTRAFWRLGDFEDDRTTRRSDV